MHSRRGHGKFMGQLTGWIKLLRVTSSTPCTTSVHAFLVSRAPCLLLGPFSFGTQIKMLVIIN